MDLGYMLFEPGDELIEYFATEEPFNAFVVLGQNRSFKGWYCNVTHPTTVQGSTIYWHDLYVDVIQRADGKVLVLDEDELHESELASRAPDTHATILAARDELLERLLARRYPFSDFGQAPDPWR